MLLIDYAKMVTKSPDGFPTITGLFLVDFGIKTGIKIKLLTHIKCVSVQKTERFFSLFHHFLPRATNFLLQLTCAVSSIRNSYGG
ncbi:hypothetical protein, partial [Bacillus sp. SD075]|uniref:hypothetical protein n=1 Tax=Bacillus sp. SD075 TaxID=2781732 RepID=UPI001A9669D0